MRDHHTYKPIEPLSFVLGVAYREQQTGKVDYFDYGGKNNWVTLDRKPTYDALDYQFGAFYDLSSEHQFHFTYAHKTNMPTQRTLYSFSSVANQFGYWPQTWLNSEQADNFEIGYKGDIDNWLQLTGAIFYSRVSDLIGSHRVYPNAARPSDNFTYYTNVGQAAYSGFEAGLKAVANEYLTVGGNVSRLISHRKDSSPDMGNAQVSQRPEWTTYLYAEISPLDDLKIIPSIYASAHGTTVNTLTDDTVAWGGYMTADLKVQYNVTENVALEIASQNLFDKKYISSGSGTDANWQAGRSYYAGVNFQY